MGVIGIDRNSIQEAMTAISRTTADAERAMMLLELINTDKELFNTLVYGISGKHYNKTGEDRIQLILDDSGKQKYNLPAWTLGCQFNAYKLPGQADDVWEQETWSAMCGLKYALLDCQISTGVTTAVFEIR
jgi:putative aldouronate transport system substrate-binding protein